MRSDSASFEPSKAETSRRGSVPLRLLITAGPTQEPIDEVRYLGNRSSGRLGVALANEAARRGMDVRILLGPVQSVHLDPKVRIDRFRTVSDLQRLLARHSTGCDVLVMAAAVADFRPVPSSAAPSGKLRREGAADGMVLHLEPTPDLLAEVAARRTPGQLIIGFALEPGSGLLDAARRKLERKGIDLIVANPLETMDSPTIDAHLVARNGMVQSPGRMTKQEFAAWLLGRVETMVQGG